MTAPRPRPYGMCQYPGRTPTPAVTHTWHAPEPDVVEVRDGSGWRVAAALIAAGIAFIAVAALAAWTLT